MSSAFSTSEAIQYGFARFGEESGYCLKLLGCVELVSLVGASMIAYHMTLLCQLITQLDSAPPDAMVYAFVGSYLLVRIPGQVLINKALLMLYDGRKISRDEVLGFDFGYHMSAALRLAAAGLVYTCWSLLGMLAIIPGILISSTRKFFKFLIVDRDADAIQSICASREIAANDTGELISLNIFTTLTRLIGILCLGIGFIPASAICGLAEVYAYKRLVQAHDSELEHVGTQPLERYS